MARSGEAKIVWVNPTRLIGTRDMADAALRPAAISAYGIRWNRAAIATPVANRINDATAFMRNSSFPYRGCDLLSLPKGSYTTTTICMDELMERHRIAAQLRLGPPSDGALPSLQHYSSELEIFRRRSIRGRFRPLIPILWQRNP